MCLSVSIWLNDSSFFFLLFTIFNIRCFCSDPVVVIYGLLVLSIGLHLFLFLFIKKKKWTFTVWKKKSNFLSKETKKIFLFKFVFNIIFFFFLYYCPLAIFYLTLNMDFCHLKPTVKRSDKYFDCLLRLAPAFEQRRKGIDLGMAAAHVLVLVQHKRNICNTWWQANNQTDQTSTLLKHRHRN